MLDGESNYCVDCGPIQMTTVSDIKVSERGKNENEDESEMKRN